ncbi:unnamed protein product, partial [marine sediment metagenome]
GDCPDEPDRVEMELLEITERLKPEGINVFIVKTLEAGLDFLKQYFV